METQIDLAELTRTAKSLLDAFWPLVALIGGLTIGFVLTNYVSKTIGFVLKPDPLTTSQNYDHFNDEIADAMQSRAWEDPNLEEEETEPGERCRYCGKLYDGNETQCHACGANR